MQADELVQETPRSSLFVDPGFGVRSRLQLVPFHASATLNPDSPVWSTPDPTAMHDAALVQVTPLKPAARAPRGRARAPLHLRRRGG